MKIIQRSHFETIVEYRLFFQRRGESYGTGCSFECDATGKVKDGLPIAAQLNYRRSSLNLEGTYDPPIVEKLEHPYRHPTIGECACGAQVELAGFTNTCECGRDYNGSGQELAPREQWGEETGESWFDCY